MSDIKQYEPLWGAWYVESTLGEGTFGKVYKVRREEFGNVFYAAVKMISVPNSEADLKQVMSELHDEASVKSHFEKCALDITQEIKLMDMFKGNTNIVSIEDYKVIEKTDSIGWDILIRMELLTTLADYVFNNPMRTEDVMQLGIDISHALEVCAIKHTIHRDIKPQNIFVSPYGDYKLGDFGVARELEKSITGSKKGTYTYMAPEVFKGEEYGASVDLYSLGIMMYFYLNHDRIPFWPQFPAPVEPGDREKALKRRMRGEEPLPDIPGIDPALNDFVLKACAYRPQDRFKDAAEFRTELEKIAGAAPKPPVQEVHELPRQGGRRPRAVRQEEDERTTGVLPVKREESVSEPKAERPQVPAKIVNVLAGLGAVCSGILTLLCLFSGRMSDLFVYMPLYAMCVASCVLNFRLSALNLVTIVWLVCYLVFGALLHFAAFDYVLLVLLLGIMVVEALRSPSMKYRLVLSITLGLCGLVAGIIIYLGISSSAVESYRVRLSSEYAIPLMMFLTAGLVMLPHREDGKIIAGLSALEMMPLIAFGVLVMVALAGKDYQVLANIVNANFIGFSPERFRWWRFGRLAGLILQVMACECLVLVAAARMTPEDFLGMLADKTRAVLACIASLLVIAAGIWAISII